MFARTLLLYGAFAGIFMMGSCSRNTTDHSGTRTDTPPPMTISPMEKAIAAPPLPKTAPPLHGFALPAVLNAPLQHYSIDAFRDTVIKGQEGTQVFFAGGSLSGVNPGDKVSVTLKEYYDIGAMLGANLSTVSYGEILETGGMIELRAYVKEKEVYLKPEEAVLIQMKELRDPGGFILFTGNRDEFGSINWEAQSQSTLVRDEVPGGYQNWEPDSFGIAFYEVFQKPGHEQLFIQDSLRTPLAKHLSANFPMQEDSMKKFWLDQGFLPRTDFEFKLSPIGKVRWAKVNSSDSKDFNQYIRKYVRKLPRLEYDRKKFNYETTFHVAIGIKASSWSSRSIVRRMHNYDSIYADVAAGVNFSPDKLFASTSLGWINCDRFYQSPSEKINQNVVCHDAGVNKAYLVFKNIRAIIEAQRYNTHFSFSNIPEGEAATLIMLSTGNGTVRINTREITISRNNITVNADAVQAIPPDKLKNLLAKL